MKEWALKELGLTLQDAQGIPGNSDEVLSELKLRARKRGRNLLGKYHPDRPSGDAQKFLALNEVLQKLDQVRIPPQIRISVTYYPSQSPYGGSITTRSSKDYNAAKAVRIKPR